MADLMAPSLPSNLDAAPPSPPLQTAKQSNLMNSGMGQEGGSPQAVALQGLAMTEQGIRLLSTALPGVTAATAEMLMTLRNAVAQQVSQMGAGPEMGGAPPSLPAPQGMV